MEGWMPPPEPLGRRLSNSSTETDICQKGGAGIFFGSGRLLPVLPTDLERSINAFIYFFLLCWCFLGTSIIADMFMAAIESITSRRKVVMQPNGRQVVVKVWNGTVANLTLMALGSSAPEILMNVIDIIAQEFHSGEIGPSTIIGSAAFNTLVILAICVISIPPGESRTIAQVWPFVVTTSFSIFAYMWLVFILSINTPDKVDIGEGVSTFLFFPVTVLLAYLADIGVLQKLFQPREAAGTERKGDKGEDSQEQRLIADGESKAPPAPSKSFENLPKARKSRAVRRMESGLSFRVAKDFSPMELSVGFLDYRYGMADDAGSTMFLTIEKTGTLAEGARVGLQLCARAGSAAMDVVSFDGFVEIQGHERFANVLLTRTAKAHAPAMAAAGSSAGVAAVRSGLAGARWPASQEATMEDWKCTTADSTDVNCEGDFDLETNLDDFYVDIVTAACLRTPDAILPRGDTVDVEMQQATRKVPIIEGQQSAHVELGFNASGVLRFERVEVRVSNMAEDRSETFKVIRMGGSSGEIACSWSTESDSAQPKLDYVEAQGTLTFPDGVTEQTIEVMLKHKPRMENTDRFFLILAGDEEVLDESCSVCAVVLMERDEAGFVDHCLRVADRALNIDAVIEGTHDWKDQFIHALMPSKGEHGESPTSLEYAVHVLACPWKLLFAFVPPVKYCGGWVTFFVALMFVGLVTALITDLASLFGCEMGLPKMINAITIVALGTSLPDTFASKLAAIEDDTADNAIGNVTGSNAVNVFLGLGLPWAMASIYWETKGSPDQAWLNKYKAQASKYPDGGFIVVAGDLTFSVILFLICSACCFGLLAYRRKLLKAELGGPYGAKVFCATFFVVLWIFYVGVASWKVHAGAVSTMAQVAAIFVGILCVILLVALFSTVEHLVKWYQQSRNKELMTILAVVNRKTGLGPKMSRPGDVEDADLDLEQVVSQMRWQIQELSRMCNTLESRVKSCDRRRTIAGRARRAAATSDFSEARSRAVTADKLAPAMEKE